MNEIIKSRILILLLMLCIDLSLGYAQTYSTLNEINNKFEQLNKTNPAKVKIHQLATSPDDNAVILVEIGSEINKTEKKLPAIFVAANPEGINPLSSNATIILANLILKNNKATNFTWYILPVLNPDAFNNYFAKTKWENPRNGLKINDDQDDAVNEDGPDDLNGDSYITQMRVKDPAGIWIPDVKDNRLMRKADPAKGEKGIYTLYTEGIDNDNDGQYNEDPEGGTNTGINFPHLFHSFTSTGGDWPGSTPEVYAVMKFVYSHPEIAATFSFGGTNFCLVPPEGGRKSLVDYNKINIPDDYSDYLGAEKGRTYTMDEIIELARPKFGPGFEITPNLISNMLGLGATMNPLPEDLVWYKELSEQYLDYLKKAKYNTERLEPEKSKDGSFELWSYYQLGIPTFSFNFFTLPKDQKEKKDSSGISLEKFEIMPIDSVIFIGQVKIDAFLKENNAPKEYSAEKLFEMFKSGQANPKQLAGELKKLQKSKKTIEVDPNLKALIAFSDKELAGKAYLNWAPFKHPTLGDVEIGGALPFTTNTPPASWADSLINIQLPWIFTVVEKLPILRISDYKVKSVGANIYQLDIWIENINYLPFPTNMGKLNANPPPAILTLDSEGIEFLTGKKRTSIKSVDGLKSIKQSFVVKVNKGGSIKAILESKFAGNDSKDIKL